MEQARDLRQRGIRAAKAGEKEEARHLLQESIRLEPDNEAAWLWLASVARDSRERLFCLQKLLEINPENEMALKALEAANQSSTPAPTVRRLPNAPVTKPAAVDLAAQQPGVPVPMPDKIAEAQKLADPIVRRYLAPPPATVKWTHKTRRRAGEGDIIVYRMYVAGAILGVLVILLAAGVVLVQTNDDVRGVVLGPSPTFTPSPTVTPTNTPGITPTASPTPRLTLTPSPTVASNVLAASPPVLPRATAEYPEILERGVFESVLLLNQGDYARAIPTLDHERELTFDTRLNPNPYYYQAVGLMRQGRFADALEILDEAVERVDERPSDLWIPPYIDSGYAQVYWAQSQQAAQNGNTTLAQEAKDLALERAEAAVTGERRLVMPYVVLAQIATSERRFGDAIEILNQGLAVPELTSNTHLTMQKAEVYLAQRSYDQALYQTFVTLYIDPSIEPAYQMQIRIALLRDRPGDAVLAAENYLYYYPGSTRAWRLLGEAREAEGKDHLAIEAYTQGLAGDVRDAAALEMLEARAAAYQRQGRFDLALADYDDLYSINGSARIQALRMQVAFEAGAYTQAVADADDLAGRASVEQGVVAFVHAASLIETAGEADRATYNEALALLNQALVAPEVADGDLRGAANEYLARAQLAIGDEEAALNAINLALDLDETGTRHYWRGRIYEASGEDALAVSDYEWVLAWSEIFPYPFRIDAQDRLEELRA